jgi:hypothetical protein
MRRADLRSTFVLVLVGLACGSDDDDHAAQTGTDTAASGFTSGSTFVETGSDTDASAGESDPLGEGDIRGILTFTFHPASPVTEADWVGVAGAWRDASMDFDEVDDFFAVVALQTTFPPPPVEEDELRHDGVPTAFDWGQADDWLRAGNAMKLVTGEVEAVACLLMLGDELPIYLASESSLQPEVCRPDPTTWLPDTSYDLVLYGGERFDTSVLPDRVHTPPALELLAPEIAHFGLAVSSDDALEIAWTDDGNPSNRIVIRMMDMFGRMFTIHAADDGHYEIPAAALRELAVGPATLTIAREQIDLVPFGDGVVKVVLRYEYWGALDLR